MPATPGSSIPSSLSNWPESYRRLGSVALGADRLAVWLSTALTDPLWDDFLRATPDGQFQQSSLWAEFKAGEGWRHHRVVVAGAAGLVGGFQILWKQSRFVRLGYVSKGPVTGPPGAELGRQLAVLLQQAARTLRLVAVIVQLPDDSLIAPDSYEENGYLRSNPMKIIEATYRLDVREDIGVLRSRMSTSLRRNLRAGKRRGVVLREGTVEDLGLFFKLMEATCQRQGTAPNPSSPAALARLWNIFAPSGAIRLIFAECAGTVVASKLNLHFGRVVTLWKKGWDGSHGESHPNELLEEESFEWARARGYEVCDFCSFSRTAIERALAGQALASGQLSSRDAYHLRFGGQPQLLPPSLVLVPHPLLRYGYRRLFLPLERRRTRAGLNNSH